MSTRLSLPRKPFETDLRVYAITATQEEVDAIELKTSNLANDSAIRPFSALGLPASCQDSLHLPDATPANTTESLLRNTRLAFLDRSVCPASLLSTSPTERHSRRLGRHRYTRLTSPDPRSNGRHPRHRRSRGRHSSPPNRSHHVSLLTTSRTSTRQCRDHPSVDRTQLHQCRTPDTSCSCRTPDKNAKLKAQSIDPNCRAIRSYLTTGHADAINGTGDACRAPSVLRPKDRHCSRAT